MGELHELCGKNFQHLLGVPWESDALRSIHSWDCPVPNPPPPYREVGRSRERWEGPGAEDGVVHLGRLAREAEDLREKQRRHELGEEGTKDSINTSDFVDDDIGGRASSYTSRFTVETEDVRYGPHLMPEHKQCKEKQRVIADRVAERANDDCVSDRLRRPRLAYRTHRDKLK
jgi:hypothetical protein